MESERATSDTSDIVSGYSLETEDVVTNDLNVRGMRATSDSFNYYYADDLRSSQDSPAEKLDASVISALRHVQFESDKEAQISRPRHKGRRQRRNIAKAFAHSTHASGMEDDVFSATSEITPMPTLSTLRRTAVVETELRRSIVQDLCDLEVATKAKDWLSSFRSLDPRYQILNFFNDLALEGVEDFETRVRGGMLKNDLTGRVPKILRGFIKAGIFSVWRPTSSDAIRKMITGEGTGKGLDIKGKSAKRGEFSGFVPFLQIHENAHKEKIGLMMRDKQVRVFYPNKLSRDGAAKKLRQLSIDMNMRGSAAARRVEEEEEYRARILRNRVTKFRRETMIKSYSGNENKTQLIDSFSEIDEDVSQREMKNIDEDLMQINRFSMQDGSVQYIDDYASKGAYGLCIPEKVFWEGYVVPNDITRVPGSKDDTGRPSMPEFQQMNIDTLRNWCDKSPAAADDDSSDSELDPRPVLWHGRCGKEWSKDCDPMCPLGLLMAYEENGNVIPVVSDFDCFLLGTRGVRYHEPLGAQELSMLSMCIDDIEGILATPKEGSSWTMRWLEVKKKHAMSKTMSHEMPRFGYADPRSYKIMTGAVHRLEANGAVRHGPECFNYGFPQDLDDQYLVVSDSFPGVPWMYTDSKGLIDILCEKIDEGYTFPLNPKWILCDPGWKDVFDKSLASKKANVQDSMNIWYPDEIRRRIHEISAKYPDGYVDSGERSADAGVQVDLAGLELHRYKVHLQTKEKIRKAFSRPSLLSAEFKDETMPDVKLKTRQKSSIFHQAMHQVVEVNEYKEKNPLKKKKKLFSSMYNIFGKK